MLQEEEDIVFENSPLEKYLKDVGYTDFVPEKTNTFTNELLTDEGTNQCSAFARVAGGLANLRSKAYWLLSSAYDEESIKRDCAAAVLNSGILNADDMEFLQRFDPELFESVEPHSSKQDQGCLAERMVSFGTNGMLTYLLTIVVGVLGVVLGTARSTSVYFYSVSFFMAAILAPFSCYLWTNHHQRSLHRQRMESLSSYTTKVKDLTSLMKKAVSLIQEMQFVFKGYTLAKTGLPMLFAGMDSEGDNKDVIYPELRECLYTNAVKLITRTQATASYLVNECPLSVELNNMFTYIGSVSLSELGLVRESQESNSKTLPLQTLKAIMSLVACQQSEFLSRFLLCFSAKAHNTGESSICFGKLYSSFEGLFTVSHREVDSSLKSIQRSYQLHKSAVAGDGPKQNPQVSREKSKSKFDPISGAVHSLQLHLKAGCLRIQSIQTLIEELKHTEDEPKTEPDENELGSLFNLIKLNLDLAMSCWEEGVHSLQVLKGQQQQSIGNITGDGKERENKEEAHVQESHAGDLHSRLVDTLEEEIDQIFEAFSEPVEEGPIDQPSLSAEDLAREKRQMEESRHLLLELKSVLYAHSKDPLISKSGFVQPPQKLASSKLGDEHCIPEVETPTESERQTSRVPMDYERKTKAGLLTEYSGETQNDSDSDVGATPPTAMQNTSALASEEYIGHGLPSFEMEADSPNFNFQSSVAFSVAAAALARSQNMGTTEEFYGSDESD